MIGAEDAGVIGGGLLVQSDGAAEVARCPLPGRSWPGSRGR
jgi:hypothetical protein